MRRIVTSDPTTEALGPILAANPRGLCVAPDEMTKWVMSMDQYKGGKGGDRPFYLSAWNGEPVVIDRAKHMKEPIMVPHPFLTVVGGMTPDMLSVLPEGRGRDDGFLARLLFAYPDRVSRSYSEEGIPDTVADSWNSLALALWRRPMRDLDGKTAPHLVMMNPEARREWAAWCRAHYAEQEADDFPDRLEGPWGKLEAYAARLALILHLMHLAADPTGPAGDVPPELPRRVIADATRLVAYFKAHARRVHAAMGGKADDGGDDVRALRRWIVRNAVESFSERDVRHHLPRFRKDEAALANALAWMTSHNMIRHAPRARGPTRPRPEANTDLRCEPSSLGERLVIAVIAETESSPGRSGNFGNNAAHLSLGGDTMANQATAPDRADWQAIRNMINLAEALTYLTGRNAIRPHEAPADKPKGGRPPSRVFDVNPALLDPQNSQNPRNPGP